MLTVNLSKLDNASPEQAAFFERARAALENAVNDAKFAGLVETAHYEQTRYNDGKGHIRSVQRSHIIDFIRSGAERGTPEDNTINLEFRLQEMDEGVLGSTYPGRFPITTALAFVNTCLQFNDVGNLAGHMIHEWLHVVGFFHFPNNRARHDVAYNVGNIVRKLARSDDQKDVLEAVVISTFEALDEAFDHADCGQHGTSHE